MSDQDKLSEHLDNILGLLLLEGSYEVNEDEEGYHVMIDTPDAGRLIGFKGESLESFQLLINQIMAGSTPTEFKRVIVDVAGWKHKKEDELKSRSEEWVKQVLETGKELVLEPMSSWQRRVVHMQIQETEGVSSESVGEGRDRHLVIRPKVKNP